MSSEENLNPISCELCRQRKCKCDRRLPFCSQCAGETSKCTYPESGKRGLPLGYLNQLEQRLAETESALYGALMTIRSMGQPITVQIPAKTDTTLKHKAARMEEWSHLALQDWAGMERWLTAMSDRFTIEQPSDVVPDTSGGYTIPMSPTHDESQTLGDQPHSRLVSYAWPPRDNRVTSGSSYDAPQPHPGVMPSPVYFEQAVEPEPVPSPGSSRDGMIDDEDAGVSVDVNASVRARVETGPSKAEELSHNNPSLYF